MANGKQWKNSNFSSYRSSLFVFELLTAGCVREQVASPRDAWFHVIMLHSNYCLFVLARIYMRECSFQFDFKAFCDWVKGEKLRLKPARCLSPSALLCYHRAVVGLIPRLLFLFSFYIFTSFFANSKFIFSQPNFPCVMVARQRLLEWRGPGQQRYTTVGAKTPRTHSTQSHPLKTAPPLMSILLWK